MFERRSTGGGPFGTISGIIIAILFFVVLFWVTKLVFKILWFISPLLFIASLIIDTKVFLDYAQWIGKMLRNNPLVGIGAIVLSALMFPLLAAFLFGKAMFKRKIRQAREEHEVRTRGELIDYEEIVDEDPLELPPIEKSRPRRPSKQDNDYDHMFD